MRNRTTDRPAKIPISTASIRKRWSSLNFDAQRRRFAANLRVNIAHSESFGRVADAGTAGVAFVILTRPPASHGTSFQSGAWPNPRQKAPRIFEWRQSRFRRPSPWPRHFDRDEGANCARSKSIAAAFSPAQRARRGSIYSHLLRRRCRTDPRVEWRALRPLKHVRPSRARKAVRNMDRMQSSSAQFRASWLPSYSPDRLCWRARGLRSLWYSFLT